MTPAEREAALERVRREKARAAAHADACRAACNALDPLTESHRRWRMFRRFEAWQRAEGRRVREEAGLLYPGWWGLRLM